MGNYIYKLSLKNKNINNTKKFEFNNKQILCKVIDVYDGDTIIVAIKFEKNIYSHKVRMYGYDSPELKPKLAIKNRQNVILSAKKARKALEDKVLNKIVILKLTNKTWDKYGRLLGTIYLKTNNYFRNSTYENINQYMIDNKYGYKYYGGTKTTNLN